MPVVRFRDEEFRLGGACNVANNITALGGRAELVGVVGDDAEARQMIGDLGARHIGIDGIVTDTERCTTRKVRVVTTRNQQVARIDYESDSEVGDRDRRGVDREARDPGRGSRGHRRSPTT